MKIMAVSDLVVNHLYSAQVRQSHPGLDLLIGCGDLPFYYLEFLGSALDVPLLYVRGNHDGGPQYTIDGRVLEGVEGGQDIHGRVIWHDGLLIGGAGGSMRYRPKASNMYSEGEMMELLFPLFPRLWWNRLRYGRALDILVTHSPPFQIHDRPDLAHTGFKIFRTLMILFRPRYLLHGHIHVYRPDTPRITRFHDTMVINVYPYRILDIDLPTGDK